VRLLDIGFPMIVNLNEALRIPQSVFVTRGEVLQKYPETTKKISEGCDPRYAVR
jgi:hypothetical protein